MQIILAYILDSISNNFSNSSRYHCRTCGKGGGVHRNNSNITTTSSLPDALFKIYINNTFFYLDLHTSQKTATMMPEATLSSWIS